MTNTLLAALGIMAPAQGTMNNLTFGQRARAVLRDDLFGVACGLRQHGLRVSGNGCRARAHDEHPLTDPEIFERRFPVVLEEFSIRRGSGGKGRWKQR